MSSLTTNRPARRTIAKGEAPIDPAVRRMLDEIHAAEYCGCSRSWLRQLRQRGGGPAYHKLGRRVLYAVDDLNDWLAQFRITR